MSTDAQSSTVGEITARLAVDRLAAAENDLANVLERVAGIVVPAQDEQVKLVLQITQARVGVELAARSVPAAARLEREACRQSQLQIADDLDPKIQEARTVLADFTAKARKLQTQLEKFTETDWIEAASARPAASSRFAVIGASKAPATKPGIRRRLQADVDSLIHEQQDLRARAENMPLPDVQSPAWAEASARLAATGDKLSPISEANLSASQARDRLAELHALSDQLETIDRGRDADQSAAMGSFSSLQELAAEQRDVEKRLRDAEARLRSLIGGDPR